MLNKANYIALLLQGNRHKMNRIVLIVLLLVGIWGVACTKSTPTPTPPPVVNTDTFVIALNATINGTAWQTHTSYGYTIITSANDSGLINLLITGATTVNGTATKIALYLTNYTGIGVYNIAPPNVSATYYNGSLRHYADSGQIAVSFDSSGYIKGTYGFKADTVRVTNGTFSVSY
jgi:hypothetical protein